MAVLAAIGMVAGKTMVITFASRPALAKEIEAASCASLLLSDIDFHESVRRSDESLGSALVRIGHTDRLEDHGGREGPESQPGEATV
jgi:hypothetical protein